jgi:hypothetical protein
MADVSLDLDPAMIDNMRREADEHGFDDLDGYVDWLLQHRDTVLNEHDVWNAPPGGVADPDADLSQSSGPSIDADLTDEASGTLEPDNGPSPDDESSLELDEELDEQDEADADIPEDEEGADDDDVAAALEEIELEDDEES